MLHVGERVEEEDDAGGAFGTVRYVGPVATSKDPSAIYYGAHMASLERPRVLLPSSLSFVTMPHSTQRHRMGLLGPRP